MPKPSPKFGWSDTAAAVHEADLALKERKETLKHWDKVEYQQKGSFTPRESEWVRYAIAALQETGARRALPYNLCVIPTT
jgi:hypothetical protein